MNVLSLRINSVKSDEKASKINLDLLKIDFNDESWSTDQVKHFEVINNLTVTELQLKELKKFTQQMTPENTDKENEKIARKLIQIYFKEKVKHPAKSTIQSCLNQSPLQELIVSSIKSEIERQTSALDNSSIADCHFFISCLNEASQNFRPAIVAIGQKVNSILTLAKKLIWAYDDQLREELSPAEKNEVSHQLHCTLQAVIFCFKTHLNDFPESNDEVKSKVSEITEKLSELLDNADLPMDTKNNCSMLIVMQSHINNDNHYVKLIKDDTSSYAKRLSLIFGVINTLSSSNIDFELLADISVILKEIVIKSSVDPAAILAVSRSFMQVTKKLTSLKTFNVRNELKIISKTAMSVAFVNLEHHLDSVRHLSRDTLKNLAEIDTIYKDSRDTDIDLLADMFDVISKLPSINLKSIVVVSIIPALKTSEIMKNLKFFHKILLDSLTDNKVTNHNLINCYEALAMKSLEEISFDSWCENFLDPVIDALKFHKPQSEERSIIENLLMRFVKKEKKILEEILKHKDGFDIGFVLLCLSTAKKTGRYEEVKSNADQWKGLISFNDIKSAMINADDNVRTSALMLLIETRKTTETFSDEEIDCIFYFLKYNVNVQSPSMRQSILGLLKNLFVRVQSILQAGVKKKDEKIIEVYCKFLKNLQEFSLENLFEGANFTRRNLSLRILFYVVEAVNEHLKEKSSEFWDKQKFEVLMKVFDDSFEANKAMTIEIMKFIPVDVIRNFSSVSLKDLETLATSIKPPDSLTASYLMEFVVKLTSPGPLEMLNHLEAFLISGLEVAEKSLIVASSTNPLYGLILGIRHLLSKLDLKTLQSLEWKEFFARLIKLCRRLTEVVAPVVNNSSPEGILPKEEVHDDWIKIVEQTTPQIILLCSWRTIKEVSLLLGDICLRGALEVDQFLTIGDHFLELLSKTKHRGAFEQCFFGFSQLCLRLWTCHEPELHKLPSEMLHQMINSISGKDKERNELLTMKNLCATRRSAGIPFMIQALITSELKVSTNKNFHFVMKNLIDFCRHGEFLETRTHSLNILRALFRCSDLNESIGEYIADGIKCAILGYGAESWIERNSSTLLFSALMVRIFGVQRTKDSEELTIRNKMTGRIFFLRYPELYDFFMEQLTEASNYVKDVKMNAKLHPLLLLLIRLYPSALEGSESNLTLSGFLPVVSMCSGCVEMPTRILCAKFIASVSPPDMLISRIQGTIDVLKATTEIPANVAHGILLQILYLVKTGEISTKDLMKIIDEICPVGLKLKKKLICYSTFLDIVQVVYEKIWKDKEEFCDKLIKHLDSCIEFEALGYFGLPMVAKKVFVLRQMRGELELSQKSEQEIHSGFLNCKLFDEFGFTEDFMLQFTLHPLLNQLLASIDFDYAVSMQDDYEISDREIFVHKQFSELRKNLMRKQISEDKSIKLFILRLITSDDFHIAVKALDILSCLNYEDGQENLEKLQGMVDNAKNFPEHMKKSLLKYSNSVVKHEDFMTKLDFGFLVEISTDSSFYVKSIASDFISTIAENLTKISSLDTILYFSKSLILLLMDDEYEIRERNSKTVMKLINQDLYNFNVIPVYAQELFIQFLLENFEKYEAFALVLLIVGDNSDGESNLDENIADFKVFDKNEINIFSESFIIKSYCLKIVKQRLVEADEVKVQDGITKIIEASRKFKGMDGEKTVMRFLESFDL